MERDPQVPEQDDFTPVERFRIEMTASCRDCDELPKVADAGEIVHEGGVRRQVMHNGLRVKEGGYHGAWMVEVIRRLHGHHEPQEERVFAEVLSHCRPGSTVIEVGAFWGYYAAWFLSQVAGARAILLEPDANNLEVGRDTFAANGLDGDFHLGAVGAEDAHEVRFPRESDGQVVGIPQFSVTSLAGKSGADEIELLLADVQGAELAALEGSRDLIESGRLRFCVVSTHHHSISGDPLTHQRCLSWIADHGGHVIAEHSVPESFSGDGLVAASFLESDRGIPPIALSHNRASRSLFPEAEHDLAEAWADQRNRPSSS